MDARKPRLLQVAAPARGSDPEVGVERPSLLVDGERVIRVLYRGEQPDLVVLVLAAVEHAPHDARRAQRADRVPHADHADRRAGLDRPDLAERVLPLRRVPALARLVAAVDVRHVVVVVLLDQAHEVHETGQAAHRERAAAEAEQVELVAGLVVVDDEPVQRADIVLHAVAERAVGDAVHRAALGADAIVVIDDLINAVRCARTDRTRDLGHVRRPALAGLLILLVTDVPGAVGAEDDPFHERLNLIR